MPARPVAAGQPERPGAGSPGAVGARGDRSVQLAGAQGRRVRGPHCHTLAGLMVGYGGGYKLWAYLLLFKNFSRLCCLQRVCLVLPVHGVHSRVPLGFVSCGGGASGEWAPRGAWRSPARRLAPGTYLLLTQVLTLSGELRRCREELLVDLLQTTRAHPGVELTQESSRGAADSVSVLHRAGRPEGSERPGTTAARDHP